MPKTFKNKRAISYMDSNVNATGDANINGDDSHDVLSDIKPNFPPTLTTNDLIKNALKSGTSNKTKVTTLPNAFIAYRMELIKEYKSKGIRLPPMGQLSKIAKKSWDEESHVVKDFYNKLARDARSLYKQSTIRIVLDNHMIQNVHTITTVNNTTFATNISESDHMVPVTTTIQSNHMTSVLTNHIPATSTEYLPIQDSVPQYEMNSIS